MEYFWWLYLATRLDGISAFFGWMTFLSVITVAASIILRIIWTTCIEDGTSEKEREEALKRYTPYRNSAIKMTYLGVFLFLLFGASYALTPTKKDAMFIAGGVGVIEATKAVAGSDVAKKSVSVIEAWLEKELADLKKTGSKAAADMQKDLDGVKDKVKEGVKEGVKEAVKEATK